MLSYLTNYFISIISRSQLHDLYYYYLLLQLTPLKLYKHMFVLCPNAVNLNDIHIRVVVSLSIGNNGVAVNPSV